MCICLLYLYSVAQPPTTDIQPKNLPSVVVTKPSCEAKGKEPSSSEWLLSDEDIEISPALERELCLSINRELHVSYCYFSMSSIYTR